LVPNKCTQNLELDGFIFDELTSVVHETPYQIPTPLLRDMELYGTHCSEMVAWHDLCWELVKPLTPYPTGEILFEAYWRTLIFNTSPGGSVAPPEYGFSYTSWISSFTTAKEIYLTINAPNPPSRDPHGKAPALVFLNLALAVAYSHSPPTSAWGWARALVLAAAANACQLLAFKVIQHSGVIFKLVKVIRLTGIAMRREKMADCSERLSTNLMMDANFASQLRGIWDGRL
jgi:hypothetical protein